MTELQKWYKDKNIFITGGTGFMGKVLVEKMLRSLPDLGDVYLLVRPKRGVSPDERLQAIKESPIFDKLKQVNKDALNKLIFLEGNIVENNLGLNDEAIECLANQVSVVFHVGASVRLECEIKDAVTINTLGTVRLLELCKKMKRVVSIVHLSTAFCYCDIPSLEEKIYESPQNPYDILELVERENDKVLKKRKFEIISPHPNAYTFSKRLAEIIVRDHSSSLPLAICRPSIVLPAYFEPIPGWVDSINGPVGILVAGAKGVLKSMLCKPDNFLEVMPVDLAINEIIVWAYYRSTQRTSEVLVANITAPRHIVAVSIKTTLKEGLDAIYKYPFEWMLWYPGGTTTTNFFYHWMRVILFQWIPALFIDCILFIVGREPFLIKVQKKISAGLNVLQYFTMKEWSFENHKSMEIIDNLLSEEDKELFKITNVTPNFTEFSTNAILGARTYIMKESMSSLPFTRLHLKILYVLDKALDVVFIYFGLKLLYYIINLFLK